MGRASDWLKGNWKWGLPSTIAAVCAIGVGIWWLKIESYTGPPKTNDGALNLARSSVIVIPLTASLDDIEKRLNAEVPKTLYKVDENRDACVAAKQAKVCLLPHIGGGCGKWLITDISPQIDCHVEGQVERGTIKLAGTGPVLSVSMPVDAKITVKGRGEVGKNIQSTATGSITATASAKVEIDENWRPTTQVSADYSWTNRIGVDVLGFRITFASKVDPKIEEAIESFKQKLPALLAALDLKSQAEKAWAQGFATIQMSTAPDTWLQFTPTGVGYSGISVEGRTLRLRIMASGQVATFVGKKPPDPSKAPLPPLSRKLPEPGFTFEVPLIADYASLISIAKSVLKFGEAQTVEVPQVGKVKATIRNVAIHQTTNQKLAIGVTVDAETPGSWFDTRGTIWMTAGIIVDNQQKRIKVDKLTVYSQTDNAPVDLLVSLVQFDPVNQAIRKAIEYDYSADYAKMIQQANAALRRQVSDDFFVLGKMDSADVRDIAVLPDALGIVFLFKGNIELNSGKLPQ